MTKMSANSAKAHFGKLLDTARREPVTIEKHGRPVAVVLSTEEYDALEALKLSRLRAEVEAGFDALHRDDFIDLDRDGMLSMSDNIKSTGRRAEKQ